MGAVLCAASFATGSTAEPRFTDLSDTLPTTHVYAGGWEHFVGGGVAVLDCNRDGYPDLFAAGGETPARLLLNRTKAPGAAPVFAPMAATDADITGVTGAYPLDMDGDGHLDLFVLRAGPNLVLRGTGDCQFEDATEAWGIDPGAAWSTAFTATWEAGRDRPTLVVGNYVDREDPDGPFEACDDHQLFRPGPETYGAPETIAPGFCALSMLIFDWNGDGRQMLWISNDRHYYVRGGQEQMFEITPRLRELGEADGWARHMLWGMGIAARDITGDGRPEVAVTSMADQYFFELESSEGRPIYAQRAFQRGTTAHIPYMGDEGRPSTGWHAEFGDVDNDGRDDLFIAKGNVEQMPGSAMRDPDNLLMQGPDGRFVEAGGTAGVGSMEKGRGGALADLNRDGLLDLVVIQRGAPMKLYQNTTEGAGHWLTLDLSLARGNVHAIGARVEVEAGGRVQTRDAVVGGGHAGGTAGPMHFGLGRETAARLRVRWPDGVWSDWAEVTADSHLTVGRGPDGIAVLSED